MSVVDPIPTVRRSTRLRSRQAPSKDTLDDLSANSRQKRRRLVVLERSLSARATDCITMGHVMRTPTSSLSKTRRTRPVHSSELLRRESALLIKEQEYKRKADELEEQIASATKKETEASLLMSQMAESEERASLQQLEEHFTCALCYEIMSHPYTMNSGQCGHTFCAICILKWFFSRFHTVCGGWHEPVDCPICRSLIMTPDHVPPLFISFPFVPNRTAAAVVESLIEKLGKPLPNLCKVKREDSEGVNLSGMRKSGGKKCNGEQAKTIPEREDQGLADWREGGIMRAEWLKKDREGRKEMRHLWNAWCALGSQEFLAMKGRLGV